MRTLLACLLRSRQRSETGRRSGGPEVRPGLIPPYTPRWNGKIERFFGTLEPNGRGQIWPDSTARDRALASFLRFYNRRPPHSAAGGQPPISRVHQVHEQDT